MSFEELLCMRVGVVLSLYNAILQYRPLHGICVAMSCVALRQGGNKINTNICVSNDCHSSRVTSAVNVGDRHGAPPAESWEWWAAIRNKDSSHDTTVGPTW